MKFEWDESKAETNIKKHGVAFDEATLVFTDVFALEEYDDAHSTMREKRYNRIGAAGKEILFVTYTVKKEGVTDETYRLISARIAEPDEKDAYEEEKFGSGFHE